MNNATTVADLLDAVHDELLVHGWTQHRLGSPEGAKCAVGAFHFTAHGTVVGELSRRTQMDAYAAFCDEIGTWAVNIWNNAEERTIDDVLDAFRRAAKNQREIAGQP